MILLCGLFGVDVTLGLHDVGFEFADQLAALVRVLDLFKKVGNALDLIFVRRGNDLIFLHVVRSFVVWYTPP